MNSFAHLADSRQYRLTLVFTLVSVLSIAGTSGCSSAPVAAQQATPAAPAKAETRPNRPAYLGILYSSPSRRASYDSGYDFLYENPYEARARKSKRGARIVEVIAASPAERAGLRIGDTIVSANGEPIVTGSTLNMQIRTMQPGDTLHLMVIRRDGRREMIPAELEALPERLHRRR